MRNWTIRGLVAIAGLALGGVGLMSITLSPGAQAMGDAPAEPKIDCRKKKNKDKPQCKKEKQSGLTDDELYQAGYWFARSGRYADALEHFRQIREQNTPRVLNYIGFATRKLGRVTQAMGYYRKALEIDPNYTLARAYLGEALIEQGNIDAAKGQLAEIASRCGAACEEYVQLSGQIRDYLENGRFKPQLPGTPKRAS
jgi:tetratricopeptide (TPR) repeat protein